MLMNIACMYKYFKWVNFSISKFSQKVTFYFICILIFLHPQVTVGANHSEFECEKKFNLASCSSDKMLQEKKDDYENFFS